MINNHKKDNQIICSCLLTVVSRAGQLAERSAADFYNKQLANNQVKRQQNNIADFVGYMDQSH